MSLLVVNGSGPTVTTQSVTINTSVVTTSTNSTPSSTTGKIIGIIIGVLAFCFIVFLIWKRVKCYRYLPVLRGKFFIIY